MDYKLWSCCTAARVILEKSEEGQQPASPFIAQLVENNLGAAFAQGEYRGNDGTCVPARRVRPEGEKEELSPPVRLDITVD